MVSSSLTDSAIKKTHSDRLFFDRYQYVLSFKLASVCCLRNTLRIHDDVAAGELIAQSFSNQQRYINQGGSWRIKDPTRIGSLEDLLDFSTKLKAHHDQVHLMVSSNYGYVYTSDLSIVRQLQQLPYITNSSVREAIVSRPRDSIELSESQYNNRSYFKDCWLSEKEKTAIANFLKNQTEVRVCPSLDKLINPRRSDSRYINLLKPDGLRLQRHHFFDHNDDSITFMLELVSPGLIRKTARILTK